ncbi:MAG: NAD(P)/FAD-dependent oxidoreductase [Theionarchaea archaeon]|nr:NAD(P)/FAD-dependent oxidoreductase [Theionarchaea archaeon]
MDRVIVIGGGISGLLSACALSREGKRVLLFEKGHLGNVVRSYSVEGDSGEYIVDTGPHIITRLTSGPLRQLMDAYVDTNPVFIPHGTYYLRINDGYYQFPWALKDIARFEPLTRKDRFLLLRCIMDGILLRDKSISVAEFIAQYDLTSSAGKLVDALCYFLAGVPMDRVPIQRFWDSQQVKDGVTDNTVKKIFNLFNQGSRHDQFYPRGGIQTITDSLVKSFKGEIIQQEVISIDPDRKHVFTSETDYPYDLIVYSGMMKTLSSLVNLPAEYRNMTDNLETSRSLTLWIGTRDEVVTRRGSEIWVDTDPPCWMVPTSLYDQSLAPEGCQLLGCAFPFIHPQKAVDAVMQVFPDLDIDMLHYQILQPDKAAWTTAPFPPITTPIPHIYAVGTDTVKKSMGITRASYSVLALLETLRGEKRL